VCLGRHYLSPDVFLSSEKQDPLSCGGISFHGMTRVNVSAIIDETARSANLNEQRTYMLFQNDFLTFPDSQKAGLVFHSERGS
jgi:hypothetical protein